MRTMRIVVLLVGFWGPADGGRLESDLMAVWRQRKAKLQVIVIVMNALIIEQIIFPQMSLLEEYLM